MNNFFHFFFDGLLERPKPSDVLLEADRLGILPPEITALKGRIQPPQHHPEGDAFVHTLLVVDRAFELDVTMDELWAAMCHDLGKALTPTDNLPHHYDHEFLGIEPTMALGARFNVPQEWTDVAVACARDHLNVHRFFDLRPVKKVDLIQRLGDYVNSVALVAQADAQGRGPTFINRPYPQGRALMDAAKIVFETRNKIGDYFHSFTTGVPMAKLDERVRRECAKAIAGKFGK